MLVLTRKMDQTITIQDPNSGVPFEVTVVEVRGGEVRLGIVAPRGVVVDRREVWEQKQQEAGLGAENRPESVPQKSR